jgi:hypothetical protein
MTLKVLRRENGQMMKLTRYETKCRDNSSTSQRIVPFDILDEVNYIYEAPINHTVQILAPQ